MWPRRADTTVGCCTSFCADVAAGRPASELITSPPGRRLVSQRIVFGLCGVYLFGVLVECLASEPLIVSNSSVYCTDRVSRGRIALCLVVLQSANGLFQVSKIPLKTWRGGILWSRIEAMRVPSRSTTSVAVDFRESVIVARSGRVQRGNLISPRQSASNVLWEVCDGGSDLSSSTTCVWGSS